MDKRLRERNFLEEKLKRVGKALQQLRADNRIRGFLRTGPFSFAKKRKIDFYVTYINGVKYVGRPISIARKPEDNNASIKISLFESEMSIRRKILETIKRL